MGILGPKLPVLIKEVKHHKTRTYIEIGCYRCETMRAMRPYVARMYGFDLFEDALKEQDNRSDLGAGEGFLPLDGPPMNHADARGMGFDVFKGDTRETLHLLPKLNIEPPCFVFLDGGHDEETVRSDWSLVTEYIPDATVMFDDVSYPGVAAVIREIPRERKQWMGHFLIRVRPS